MSPSPNVTEGSGVNYTAYTEEILRFNSETGPSSSFDDKSTGTVAEKLEISAPYHFFLTTIASSPETHAELNSISFEEIFDSTLGEIECTVQINYVVDLAWLLEQYGRKGCADIPTLILFGFDNEDQLNSDKKHLILKQYPNVKMQFISTGGEYGIHHAKIMLIGYRDQSMRVIVSTANLYHEDWHDRTNGVWISPRCYRMTENFENGESRTHFREDLIEFLSWYKVNDLAQWIERIRATNFSAINVFLVTSIPGWHRDISRKLFGHWRLGNLLAEHSAPINISSPVVAQSSSVGSFGSTPKKAYWLFKELMESFGQCSGSQGLPQFRMVYPSLKNVMDSFDCVEAAGGLPYSDEVHRKQKWIERYMYQWKANQRFRSRAMPHIKTYARWTDKQLHWFLLTSANTSKSAWGRILKRNFLSISNVEAGVLFLPKFVIGREHFSTEDCPMEKIPVFPLVYDIPCVPYKANDKAFRSELLEM